MKDKLHSFYIFASAAFIFLLASCSQSTGPVQERAFTREFQEEQAQYKHILENEDLPSQTRFGVINQLSKNMLAVKDYNNLIIFLTDWVEAHPDDEYNAYWLLMTAFAYLENEADPMAQYYFERILINYEDLIVDGTSVHYRCLMHLIKLCDTPATRIKYFNQLIARFPNEVSTTELYVRMALEYEKEGDWKQALKCLQLFLDQEDAATIQITDIPNAYMMARQLINFNNSSKDWTYSSLDRLIRDIKVAINDYDPYTLDTLKSKVNFFAMSWRQDETAANAQDEFTMDSYMIGNTIHYASTIDESSTPNEAYLKTWGWTSYLNVWYFYFRRVNFPADPDIHGRWEWAGIYYGEKM